MCVWHKSDTVTFILLYLFNPWNKYCLMEKRSGYWLTWEPIRKSGACIQLRPHIRGAKHEVIPGHTPASALLTGQRRSSVRPPDRWFIKEGTTWPPGVRKTPERNEKNRRGTQGQPAWGQRPGLLRTRAKRDDCLLVEIISRDLLVSFAIKIIVNSLL